MDTNTIVCPKCCSVISFEEGTIVERCIACKTPFQVPGAVKVSARPEGATVVQVEPVGVEANTGGGAE